MSINELKEKIYTVISDYFTYATVIWAEQANVKPQPPYIVIKLINVSKEPYVVGDDIDSRQFYHCSAKMEINFFTKGEPVVVRRNETISYKNSALSDLLDFADYLESVRITDILMKDDISLQLVSPIQDLTMLENSSSFRYRAMAEFVIYFTDEASGGYGMKDKDISTSSGANIVDFLEDLSYIEEISLNKEE